MFHNFISFQCPPCFFLQVAFWIVKTDTPSRTSLGIITILSVTKIGFGGKTKPKVWGWIGDRISGWSITKVGYSTALDIYNVICFAFTFAALFEFVIINFIGMFIQRYCQLLLGRKNQAPIPYIVQKVAPLSLSTESERFLKNLSNMALIPPPLNMLKQAHKAR